MQNFLSLRQASLHFSQISTSVLLTPIAVASMRCVTILLDRTHASVKQDTQEMEEHALVSRFDLFLEDSCKLFTRVQTKKVLVGQTTTNNNGKTYILLNIADIIS